MYRPSLPHSSEPEPELQLQIQLSRISSASRLGSIDQGRLDRKPALRLMTQRRAVTRALAEAATLARLGEQFGGSRVEPRLGLLESAPSLDSVELQSRRVLLFGDVPDVVGLRRESDDRRRVVGCLDDRRAVEDSFDGGLAELPAAGPEQADGAVDGVDDPSTSFVEERPENS